MKTYPDQDNKIHGLKNLYTIAEKEPICIKKEKGKTFFFISEEDIEKLYFWNISQQKNNIKKEKHPQISKLLNDIKDFGGMNEDETSELKTHSKNFRDEFNL